MKEETKYKLIMTIPFQIMLWLFVIACIAGEYFYQHESIKGQIVVWGTFVSIVVGFLVYIRVKNK